MQISDGPADAEALRARVAAQDGFTGAVLAVCEGEVLLDEAHGFADREANVPNETGTLFAFGSVMKEFTAAAIFQLEVDGLLRRSDTLGSFFDEVPSDKAGITLDHLLAHASGLDEYHDTTGDFEPMTRDEAIARIMRQQLAFAPGSAQAYSNSGFSLLAAVVERVTRTPFSDYIRRTLFEPAGMRSAGFPGDGHWREGDVAYGYGPRSVGPRNSPLHWPSPTWALIGNGGLISSVHDMAAWLTSLEAKSVMSARAREAYLRDYLVPNASNFDGVTVYGFAGANDFGFSGLVAWAPEREAYLIMATNAMRTHEFEGFGLQLSQLLLGASMRQ